MSDSEGPSTSAGHCADPAAAEPQSDATLPAVALRWLQQVIFDECLCAVQLPTPAVAVPARKVSSGRESGG